MSAVLRMAPVVEIVPWLKKNRYIYLIIFEIFKHFSNFSPPPPAGVVHVMYCMYVRITIIIILLSPLFLFFKWFVCKFVWFSLSIYPPMALHMCRQKTGTLRTHGNRGQKRKREGKHTLYVCMHAYVCMCARYIHCTRADVSFVSLVWCAWHTHTHTHTHLHFSMWCVWP